MKPMNNSPITPVAPPYALVDAKHGKFLVNSQDTYIGNSMLSYGEYSEIELEFIIQHIPEGRDVIEVGSNIGTHSVPLAKYVAIEGRRLMCVEMQPEVFHLMKTNVMINCHNNVDMFNIAAGDLEGVVYFSEPDYGRQNNFGGVSVATDEEARKMPNPKEIPIHRLDGIIPLSYTNIGLIKIDVEGFELPVLKGLRKTIKTHFPVLYLENDRVDKSSELIQYILDLGYKVKWHIPYLFNPTNHFSSKQNLFGNVASFNMIAIHPSTYIDKTWFNKLYDVDPKGPHPSTRQI